MKYKNLVLKKSRFAVIKLNRPKKLNALNIETIREIKKAVSEIGDRVLIFTGAGKSFCAGADISEMSSFDKKEAKQFADLLNGVLNKIETLDQPVIAAINGFALGAGNELAMACDIRIGSPKAKFGQPEVKIGIPPGAGATVRLPRIIGFPKAKEMIYTGRIIDSYEAAGAGLINGISPAPLKEAEKIARKISENSPKAVSTAKRLMNISRKSNRSEITEWVKFFGTGDQKEGMDAFLKKRKPRF